MNLEVFFDKFGVVADLPNANASFREIILQLSVRGKLTSQNPHESTLAQLKLAESFRLCRGKRTEPDTEDIPFSIPKAWGWVALGDAMDMLNGRAFKPEEWSADGVPIIRIQNLNNEHAPFNRCATDIDTRFHVNSGDFLISWSGTPGTSFGAFIWSRGFAYLNQHIFRCELVEGVFQKEFLRLAVNARLDEMISQAHCAVGLRHITKGKLESIRLPVPPLAEQKRIVAKVDELMALCDRLDAEQKERETKYAALAQASLSRFAENPTPGNLNYLFHSSYSVSPQHLRKTVQTLAIQGRLIAQNADSTTVDDLLEAVAQDRKRQGRSTVNSVCSMEMESSTGFQIPRTWRWMTLEGLLVLGPTNGISPKAVEHETEVRSLTLSATTSGSFKGEHSKFISENIPFHSELWLRAGDILIQRGNTIEYVGVSAIYHGEPNRFIYPDLMMKIRVSQFLDADYVQLAMNAPYSRDYLRSRASGTSGTMPKINQTALKSLPIPIPPLAEQKEIVAKVNEVMRHIDQLEIQIARAGDRGSELIGAIIAQLTELK